MFAFQFFIYCSKNKGAAIAEDKHHSPGLFALPDKTKYENINVPNKTNPTYFIYSEFDSVNTHKNIIKYIKPKLILIFGKFVKKSHLKQFVSVKLIPISFSNTLNITRNETMPQIIR